MSRFADSILLPKQTRSMIAKENAMSHKPTRCKYAILKQICELIPPHLVPKLATRFGVDKKARTFSPWSHVIVLLYTQLAHALSLNDVCDALKNRAGKLIRIRVAAPPSNWSGRRRASPISTKAAGKSRCFSRRSNRRRSCAISWATTKMPSRGRCGRR